MAMKNGTELQDALTALVHSQATLTQTQAEFVLQLNETYKHQAESDRRFARIEDELEQIKAILVQHGHVLAGLPEAIWQKVGFKTGR